MELWAKVLDRIRGEISKPSFDTWFTQTSAEIEDDVIVVTASNAFAADWLVERYKPLIFETVREIKGRPYEIEIFSSDQTLVKEDSSYSYNLKNLIEEQNKLLKKQQKKIDELEQRILKLEIDCSS